MFTRLDRYITKELLGPFLFGIIAFTAILTGSTILVPLMNEAAKYGIPLHQVVQLFIYQVPGIVVFTFPMATLLATILAFGRLNSDLEIIAFRSAGISFLRMVRPVIVAGFVISFVTIWFNESIVPKATHSAETLFNVIKNNDKPTIRNNINFTQYDEDKRPQRIINVQKVDKGNLIGVTVLEYDDGELVRAIKSDNGRWIQDGGWEFYDGIMYYFTKSNSKQAVLIEFEKEFINIRLDPTKFSRREKDAEEMNAAELRRRIDLKKRTGQIYIKDLIRYHMKFSVPFASLIFSILGASVGLRPHRSSSAMGLGISLIIILIYYLLIGTAMGLAQSMPALIAAWIPNIIVGSVGVWRLVKIGNQ